MVRKYLIFVLAFLFACGPAKEKKGMETINIYGASSTTLPVSEISALYSNFNKVNIQTNFASSGTLARQIYNGAEADIYISANKQWIDFLAEKKMLKDSSIRVFAKNKLVVVCPKKNEHLDIEFSKDFDIIASVKNKITIGNPEYVPAGNYARQVLEKLSWYNQLKEKTILAKDVVSVLHYVELGECDWGIVYYSEALKSDKVRIAYEIPEDLYSPVIFYISQVKGAGAPSNDLYEYFFSEQARGVFGKNGFRVGM